jgi:hypothetical protein
LRPKIIFVRLLSFRSLQESETVRRSNRADREVSLLGLAERFPLVHVLLAAAPACSFMTLATTSARRENPATLPTCYVFDATASYDPMWWIVAALGIVVAVLHLPID